MKNILPLSVAMLFLFAPAFPYIARLLPTADAPDIPFHTIANPQAKALPQHIEESITIGPEDGVIALHTIVTIGKNARLTILPGTTIAAAEYTGIRVLGSLSVQGTQQNPVQFISNELNETNRTWNGILFTDTGSGHIEHAIFHHASPAISCHTSGKVEMNSNAYQFGNLDVWGSC